MGANKYRKHVLVLPEDRADHQIAVGFQLHDSVDQRAIQVLPNAGGWSKVRDEFATVHVIEMRNRPQRHMVLLVDFDRQGSRLDDMWSVVPQDIRDRVFVVGVWSEPEDLRREANMSCETIGQKLASECCDDSRELWEHPLLQHNAKELERMTAVLKPFLFRSS